MPSARQSASNSSRTAESSEALRWASQFSTGAMRSTIRGRTACPPSSAAGEIDACDLVKGLGNGTHAQQRARHLTGCGVPDAARDPRSGRGPDPTHSSTPRKQSASIRAPSGPPDLRNPRRGHALRRRLPDAPSRLSPRLRSLHVVVPSDVRAGAGRTPSVGGDRCRPDGPAGLRSGSGVLLRSGSPGVCRMVRLARTPGVLRLHGSFATRGHGEREKRKGSLCHTCLTPWRCVA